MKTLSLNVIYKLIINVSLVALIFLTNVNAQDFSGDYDVAHSQAVEAAKKDFYQSIVGGNPGASPGGASGSGACITACAYAFAEVTVECFASACVECGTKMICVYSKSSAWAKAEAYSCVSACTGQQSNACNQVAKDPATVPVTQARIVPFFNLMRVLSMPKTARSNPNANVRNAALNSTSATLDYVRYGLWNKFIQLVNIFEIVNPSDVAINVELKIGNKVRNVNVKANSQADVLIDSMFDLVANTYGIIEAKSNRIFHSRVVQYRPGTKGFSNLQAASSSEVVPALRGESSVLTNTFDPSGRGVQVAAWLSLVNLADTAKKFIVSTYLQDGTLKLVREVTVAAFSRSDIEGGHESLGANQVAQFVITPSDVDAPYLASLARYGLDGAKYVFATSTPARVGSKDVSYVSVANAPSLTDWLEVANPTDSPATYHVEINANTGVNRYRADINIAAHAQVHLPAHQYLKLGEYGFAAISSNGAKSLVSSMFYQYNPATKTVVAYNSLARSVLDTTVYSSANFFIKHKNKLLVSAIEDGVTNFSVNVGSVNIGPISVPSKGSVLVDLSDYAKYGTTKDTYSIVKISADKNIFSEVYRELDKRYVVPVPSLLYGGNASDTEEAPEELVNKQFINEYAQARSLEVADLIRQQIASGATPDSAKVEEFKKDYSNFSMLSRMLNADQPANQPAGGKVVIPISCVAGCAWAWAHAEAYCFASAYAYCPFTGAFAFGYGKAHARASAWGFACAFACAWNSGGNCSSSSSSSSDSSSSDSSSSNSSSSDSSSSSSDASSSSNSSASSSVM